MNKVFAIGRLTRDPEIRYTQGAESTCVARFSLAVDRRIKREGDASADFLTCVAFGKQGEFAEKYLAKGTKIAIAGRIQTGSYTNKDGQKVYTTDIVVEEYDFCESKNASSGSAPASADSSVGTGGDGFMTIPDNIDTDLPFA